VQIFKLAGMVNSGGYLKPIPFGGVDKPVDQNGFSDHFRSRRLLFTCRLDCRLLPRP
jgi:hypothetical protein